MTLPDPGALLAQLGRAALRDVSAAARCADGAPDVTGLVCDVLAGRDGQYMRRYHRTSRRRFHRILTGDPQPHFHDHPWDFAAVLLDGSYLERTPRGVVTWTAPCVIFRRAEDLHRLELPEGPCWTYVVTGRVRRRWGFATPRGWVHWREYPGAGDISACSDPQAGRW